MFSSETLVRRFLLILVIIVQTTLLLTPDAYVTAQDDDSDDKSKTPDGYNCEPLNDIFQVRWKVLSDEEKLAVELVGLIDNTEYLSFGPSGSDKKTVMVGSDIVIADLYQDQTRARDFFMNFKAECLDGYAAGVCPDTDLGSSAQNDVSDISGEHDPVSGMTVIRYKRPLSASDGSIPARDEDDPPIPVDRPIIVTPGNITYVTWAIGPISTDTGIPKLHTDYSRNGDVTMEFGRTPIVDNCLPMVAVPSPPPQPSSPSKGDENTAIVDCAPGNFQNTIEIVNDLSMSYLVLENTMTVRMIYNGNAWISLAISENPAGSMIGAEAIIGLTSEDGNTNDDVAKWDLNSRDVPGVVRMEESKQTLTNTSITQENGVTSLTFTKFLVEPSSSDELTINGTGGDTVFLWAYGNANELESSHKNRGVFKLTLDQCNEQGSSSPGSSIVFVDDGTKSLFAAHGVLAAVAWGVFVPLALASSLLRQLLIPCNAKLWFNLHMTLNVLAFVMTLASFILAINATTKKTPAGEDVNHFDGLHQKIGLSIMVLVFVQILGGFFRPHPPSAASSAHNNDDDDSDKKESTKEHATDTGNATGTNRDISLDEELKKPTDEEEPPPKKTIVRRLWELFHKPLGFFLLGFSWYQVQDGFTLFTSIYPNEKDYTGIFWIVVACLGGITLVACYHILKNYEKKK